MSSWILLGGLFFLSLLFGILSPLSFREKTVIQTKAFSCGAFNPPSPQDVAALQNRINAAHDGEVINLPAGTYSGPVFTPMGLGDSIFVSAARGGASSCLIRIDGKRITLKGVGPNQTIFYGDGHSPTGADKDPYKTRGGICILNNSSVTLDSVRIKEFQKRGVVVYNSAVVVKNSIIEGHDEGGVSLLGNSTGLFVNNFFQSMNFGAVMLWQNSQAKIVNNIFNDAAVMFFYHPGTDDKAYAHVINNIFSSGSREPVKQVDWWPQEAPRLKTNQFSHNLFQRADCNPALEYCDAFPGKITGDPLYTEPVGDMCGIAPWANFTLKEGSPAIGSGDPSIPGTNTLGNAGGPCADGNSSMCANYIAQNLPKPPASPTTAPAPTVPQPTAQPRPTDLPLPTDNQLPAQPSQTPTPPSEPRDMNVLLIENGGSSRLNVKGFQLDNRYVNLNQKVEAGMAIQYPLGSVCNQGEVDGGLAYEDPGSQLMYVAITIHCGHANVVDIY